jgi:hypothetical protein
MTQIRDRTRLGIKQGNTRRERFASRVSFLFNPLLIGIPVILLIGAKDVGEIRLELVPTIFLCVGILCIFPLIYILALMRAGLVNDFHITDRRQRVYLFPVMLVCLVVVVAILWRTEGVSPLVRDLLVVGFCSCLACALITLRFKISLHCSGLGWLVVGLYYSFGAAVGLVGLAGLGLAAWSRLVVREHTLPEVAAGSVFGLGSTWLGMVHFFHY